MLLKHIRLEIANSKGRIVFSNYQKKKQLDWWKKESKESQSKEQIY